MREVLRIFITIQILPQEQQLSAESHLKLADITLFAGFFSSPLSCDLENETQVSFSLMQNLTLEWWTTWRVLWPQASHRTSTHHGRMSSPRLNPVCTWTCRHRLHPHPLHPQPLPVAPHPPPSAAHPRTSWAWSSFAAQTEIMSAFEVDGGEMNHNTPKQKTKLAYMEFGLLSQRSKGEVTTNWSLVNSAIRERQPSLPKCLCRTVGLFSEALWCKKLIAEM